MNAARMRALLLVLLAAGSIAAPFAETSIKSDNKCRAKTRFEPGKEFTYSYVGETISGINGSSEARSALRIAARCIIQSVGNCRHRLRINQVELWEAQSKTLLPREYRLSKETAKFARELEAHDLFFRSERGSIRDVTPAPGEPPNVFNIKKGILSALQVQMLDKNAVVEESDIAGKCKVNYQVHTRYLNARPKVVSKSRNLTDCTERSKTDLGIHIHHYNEKTISLLSSSSNCRYVLNTKWRVEKVVCEEKHIFRPFSAGYKTTAGAFTTAKQVLKLTSVSRARGSTFPINDFKSEPLTYEHVHTRSDSKDIYTAEEIITRLVQESMEETKPDSARLFSRLVFELRKLQPKVIEFFWERVFDCDKSGLCKPSEKDRFQMYLLDALPHCGTAGCAKVMSHAIKNDLISGERGNMFLTGLALVSKPTEGMIEHLLDLCQTRPSRSSMLTLGTLIHKFCEENTCDELDYQSPVVLAERWLQSLLGKRCDFSNPEQAEEILIALKAIGNSGRPTSAQNTILHCAVNDNLPINMTIVALEALRRMPCRQETTEQLLNIYGSHYYDVEIRIASYLALLKCPSVALFQRIAKIQRTEVNNQVGSFVWSHLRNAMESTEPRNGLPVAKMIHKAFEGKVLREFNLNRLRFSRAVEGSFYSDILRAGGSVQGHLIYHPNSFFPRSAALNLTIDVLGASINLFDAAARFEGFEILLEQFFGADGYFPDERVMAMFNLKPHEERDKEERTVNSYSIIRGRRSLTNDINRVESHLNKLNRKMDIRKHAPSGAMSVKVFGNEMRLASFEDLNWLQSEADNINFVDFLMTLAKGGSKTITKSLVFLDAETTVPTALGLPLKLDAKGTSVVSVEMNGKFDIRNMFWGPMAFDIHGHLKPSAVVEITGRMGVNALFAEAGILINSSVYTSTEIKGNGTYKQGQVLKFELGAPKKPFQVFNVSSSLFSTLNGEELKIDGAKKRVEPAPCLNATRVLGIAVCGRLSVPVAFREYESPFFPLSGSASFSLSVIPTDPKLRLYQLVAQRLPTEDENKYDMIARMSTPNATWEREFVANASLWLEEDEKSFSLSTGALGYKFGKLEGSYNNKTHAVNLTFSTRDVIYGNRMVLNANYFNDTDPITKNRRMGTTWSATYKNYTVRQLTELYNKSGIYGFTSNTTYWPGKYIYANGEVNVHKKSFEIIANHTCTKTYVCLNGSLGEKEHNFFFNFTTKPANFSIQTTGKYNKAKKEAVLNAFVKPCKQSFTMRTAFANKDTEKGIHVRASHDNKNRVFTWYAGIVNATKEKAFKANSTIMGKPMEAVWTFFNHTSEKGLKFHGSAIGKSFDTALTYLKSDTEKTVKFNASGFNKKAEAMWSYLNRGIEKSLTFNASTLNKSVSAVWTYLGMKNEKSVKFNATALNKTVTAVWSFLNLTNEKSLKFHATGINKTVDAVWSYLTSENEKTLRFNAAALNKTMEAFLAFSKIGSASKLSFNATVLKKTIQSSLTFFNLTNEKILKMNATVLNRTVEAMWTVFNYASEKGLRFETRGFNKSASAVMSYITRPADKALKFNATVMNKTVEAMWSYLHRGEERFAKFNVTAMNKTMEAVWTYFNFASERGLKFNFAGLNKTAEAVMAYFHTASEKGVKLNVTVMKKSINATLAYFKYMDNMGVRFNASGFNRTVELMSKMLTKNEEKKLVMSGSYQNYTVALVGLFQNLTLRKSLCFHPEILGRGYGKVCATFSNGTGEQMISLNISALNRTAEIKSHRIEKPHFCANRFTVSYNNTVYLESWAKLVHKADQKILQLNATVAKRSVDAKFFFEKGVDEKVVGFNFTVLKKTMGMKAHLINQEKFKEASVHLMWSNIYFAKSALRFHNLTTEKIIKFRNQIGNFVSEVKGEYIVQQTGEKRTFVFVRMLRNGSKSLFYDRSEISYLSMNGKRREMEGHYTIRILGRSFSYGLEFSHHNNSDEILTHHQFKTAVIYSRGKRMSVTSIFRHDVNEMSKNIIVEYLPGKRMQHSVVWYKQRNFVATTWELLPRIPVRHTVEWNKRDGLFIRHTASAFGKRIASYFRFSKRSESYDGKLEIWPRKMITFRGQFSRAKGLLLTSQITAFQKTWSQNIDFNKVKKYLIVSLEVIPRAPAYFEARWDTSEGLKINTELTAFKKSLKWDGFYERLSKTWTSDLTIMKEKITFVESFDINTKTLAVSVKARGRAIGFMGRFDWNAYVASAYLTCNEHKTGWFLKMDTENRNIIYNITLTSRLSGQIAAEMPNDNQLQVTFQRKFGANVVNESRFGYQLTPEASRVFVTWNTTTAKYLVGQAKSLKPMVMNATTKIYNMTLVRAKKLSLEVDKMVKKFEHKIKPVVMKYLKHVKSYDFKGLFKNASIIAQNMSMKSLNLTMKAYNLALKALNTTVKNLPMLARNATILYKKIRAELNASIPLIYNNITLYLNKTKLHLNYIKGNLTLHLGNVSLHLKNISRGLNSWGSNLTKMVGDIKVRGLKLKAIAERVMTKATLISKALSKNITVHLKKLHTKVRELEIRKQKLGPIMDKYMAQIRTFTCNFNATCTLKNLSKIAMNISQVAMNMTLKLKNLTVLNKTVHQHFLFLREKANNLSKNFTILRKKIERLTVKMIKLAPHFMKNTTIKAIELARNISKDIQKMTTEITMKVKMMSSKALVQVEKYTKPLTKLIVKVSVSIYNRAKPVVLSYVESSKPMIKNLMDLKRNMILFNKPMMKPIGPMAMDVMYQLLNITIHKLPVGVLLDKAIKVSIEEGTEMFKSLNHTLTTNITTVIRFINDLSKKTPEQIVDITILKITELVNATKKMVNNSIHHTFNSTKQALKAYRETIKNINRTIFKVINMKPEDLVQISITKVHLFAKKMTLLIQNITAEFRNISKQLKNLDFVSPAQKAWKEMDMFNRFASLDMKAKWESIILQAKAHIKALDVKSRALDVKSRAENYGLKVMKELKEVSAVAYRAYELILRLGRMDITREQFVKELIAIVDSAKTVGRKHFHIAKNTTFGLYDVHQRYWKSAAIAAYSYKAATSQKTKEMYETAKKYMSDFYKEHEVESMEAYNFYKNIALELYDVFEKEALVLKGKVSHKIALFKAKLIHKIETLVMKLRKYENMTYEEIALKVYKLSKDFGLALYKNYSVKVMKMYNNIKNLTMRTYNLTQMLAVKYFNMSRTMAIKYYKLSRVNALRIFKNTKNFTLTYYKIYKNKSIVVFYLAKNMTIKAFNTTRNMTIDYIKYFNSIIRPKMIAYYGKGKELAVKYYKDGIQLGKNGIEKVKVWYADNKEKTVEELYNEAYTIVKTRNDKMVLRVKAEYQKVMEKVKAAFQKLNKTVMNLTMEVVSVYKQTKNVTIISSKQLIAIFHPYAKSAQNKTMILIFKIKNASIPLIQKAKNLTIIHFNKAKNFTLNNLQKVKNLTLINIQKAKNFTMELYSNITNRKDFKKFMAKYQVKERYAKVVAKIEELIAKAKEMRAKIERYIKENKPKVEAKIKEAIHYLNVTLPKMIKEKRAEIMADPKAYAKAMYARAEGKARAAIDEATNKLKEAYKNTYKKTIENTAVEQIIRHEIWGEFLEEFKQHEIVEAGKDIYGFGKGKTTQAIAQLKEKLKELEAKLMELKTKLNVKVDEMKQKAKEMIEKTKDSIKKGFEDFKQMKLREIVEHRYVYKTIEFAKNTTDKVKNMTLQAKKMTLKAIAISKVYYKNISIKAKKLIAKIEKFALAVKKNITLTYDKYRPTIMKYKKMATNYTRLAKIMTIKYYKIGRKFIEVKINETRVFVNKTIEKGIKIYNEKVVVYYKQKIVPYYKNKVIPFYNNKVIPACKKYKALVIEFGKNMTVKAKKLIINSRPYKFTVKSYHITVKALRDASKLTIRQSVLMLRKGTIIAYNYGVNLTNQAVNMTKVAVNMTIQRFNTTKIYLTKLANNTVSSIKPYLPILNRIKNEVVETLKFISKYYGIEDKVRAHVERQYAMLQHHYVRYQKHTEKMPGILKSSAYSALEYVNKTIRYVNRTIGMLNETMNKNVMMLRMRWAKMRFNLPQYIQIKDGVVSFNIPHPRPINGNIKTVCRAACNKVKHLTYKAINMTRHYINMTKQYAKLYQMKAMNMSKLYKQIALNKTMVLRIKAYNLTMMVYNKTMSYKIVRRYVNTTIHYLNITRHFVREFNLTKMANLTKTYYPVVYNFTKEWCRVGFNATRNFTLQVTNIAWNITADIYNSTSLKVALAKARNHSMKAYNETLKIYRILYKKTMIRYAELRKIAEELYKRIGEHELTRRYIHHTRMYLGHSKKILRTRARHFHHLKKYWHRRISHKLNHISKLLTPRNWVPPFNSTAMIFGKPHVYTFDGFYYRFPGYNKPDCTYVLARDVRDDKFTLLSQEESIILITKDGNVKIHSSGRVESMVKIDTQGNKIHDGYNSELPVETLNMTVTREGPFTVLRHAMGLEILCDIEHNVCTFNIDKWFHGRLAGLLGTNNNEHHDDMMKPNNKPARNLVDFVNSWEISKDSRCHIRTHRKQPKCSMSKYSSRCRELFKDIHSPLAPYFNITNPRPFLKACEDDYADCETSTAKDMKHCNTTSAYIELLRMKGEWVEYLPECGRCANHEMGHKWFQRGHNLVDVVIVVPETQGMRGFAKKIPNYITELRRDLGKYSFNFGIVSFGGQGIHSEPHVVTVNGKHFGDAAEVQNAIEHLKFADTSDSESDGFEAIAEAARYPFRAGSTKIIMLLTTNERHARPGAPCLRRMTKKLKMQDITLNIIGKYRKYRGDVIGQDYRGKVFYRKHLRGMGTGVALPEGQYIELMKNTKGSVFGLTLFASDDRKRAGAVRMATVNVWKEQIKRDQKTCKECFCVRGLVGEGRCICKINEFHKC